MIKEGHINLYTTGSPSENKQETPNQKDTPVKEDIFWELFIISAVDQKLQSLLTANVIA